MSDQKENNNDNTKYNCDLITLGARNCNISFYHNTSNGITDCSKYCWEKCNEWFLDWCEKLYESCIDIPISGFFMLTDGSPTSYTIKGLKNKWFKDNNVTGEERTPEEANKIISILMKNTDYDKSGVIVDDNHEIEYQMGKGVYLRITIEYDLNMKEAANILTCNKEKVTKIIHSYADIINRFKILDNRVWFEDEVEDGRNHVRFNIFTKIV
jgi:hypothetical protein